MPNIMVLADRADGGDAAVFLAERLMTVQLDDAHFAAQLVERLKWAGEDAEHAERETAIRQAQTTPPRRATERFRGRGVLIPTPTQRPARAMHLAGRREK
jgi:hypothetical protein